MALKDLFFPHFADFRGKPASLDLKRIGKLLPVIRNRKSVASAFLYLKQKISHQFFTGAALGGDFDFLMKYKVLSCHDIQKIENHPAVERT
jgi:hypothetical protein